MAQSFRYRICIALMLILLGTGACSTKPSATKQTVNILESQWIRHMTVPGQFDEVKSFLELAITDRGIKINNTSHIAEMLERTAAEVGADKVLYTHEQAIEFCSATISRDMMQSNSHYITLCPYIIYIYELPQQKDVIHIAYRNPLLYDPQDPALQAVDKLLQEITNELRP